MGICQVKEKERKQGKNNSNGNILNTSAHFPKQYNPNSVISNKVSQTIIKSIGQINGDAIRIDKCNSCIIMIMDYSSSVIIQECKDSSIFIAPSSSSILIQKCQNINLISASSQLRITEVANGNFFSFSSTGPAVELSKNIKIGMFFVQYMELVDMFKKSKLNIWYNSWSEFQTFKIAENEVEVSYSDENNKQKVIEAFSSGFNDSYINVDQYQFLPFTYGKSYKNIGLSSKPLTNILIFFKEEDCNEGDVLKFLSPDELSERNCKLIKTTVLKENSEKYNEIKRKFQSSQNSFLSDYFSPGRITKQKTNKSNIADNKNDTAKKSKINLDMTGNEGPYNSISNIKFLSKKDLLVLWLISENNELDEFKDYLDSIFDSSFLAMVLSLDIQMQEKDYQIYISKIFNFDI